MQRFFANDDYIDQNVLTGEKDKSKTDIVASAWVWYKRSEAYEAVCDTEKREAVVDLQTVCLLVFKGLSKGEQHHHSERRQHKHVNLKEWIVLQNADCDNEDYPSQHEEDWPENSPVSVSQVQHFVGRHVLVLKSLRPKLAEFWPEV